MKVVGVRGKDVDVRARVGNGVGNCVFVKFVVVIELVVGVSVGVSVVTVCIGVVVINLLVVTVLLVSSPLLLSLSLSLFPPAPPLVWFEIFRSSATTSPFKALSESHDWPSRVKVF